METRWGLGPVFRLELMRNARRWQVYAGRSLFVLALLVGMTLVWVTHAPDSVVPGGGGPTIRTMAKVGEWFFYALTGIQVSLVLLAAPAAAAGSMGMDRAREPVAHDGHRPFGRRDRHRHARRQAGAGVGADRLRGADHGARGLAGRHRSPRAGRDVRRVAGTGAPGLRAGLDRFRLGPQDA